MQTENGRSDTEIISRGHLEGLFDGKQDCIALSAHCHWMTSVEMEHVRLVGITTHLTIHLKWVRSIHPFSIPAYSSLGSRGSWSLSQLTTGEGRNPP